jgi:hypothetical protein
MNGKDIKLNDKTWDQVYLKYQKNSTLGVRYPNSRLVGLTPFLYRNKSQFNDTYGQFFEISVGYDEFNTYRYFLKILCRYWQKNNLNI